MKPADKFDDKYFLKYSEKPVKIRLFNPKARVIAEEYVDILKKLLDGLGCEIGVRGSTLFGIAGKGDVEIGVHTDSKRWDKVLAKLKREYGEAENKEEDYARFNLEEKGFEVEIIVLKGYEAKLDKALTLYLSKHSKLLREYENVKKKYSYSKREYQIQKNKFFIRVTKNIPKNYF